LSKTPLHALHVALGAKMVPFAGYDMPVSYPSGILADIASARVGRALRRLAHGAAALVGADAAAALETLVPVDVVGLAEGRQRYALFTNDEGGILDDLMVTRRADHLFLVVNASCKADDMSICARASAAAAGSSDARSRPARAARSEGRGGDGTAGAVARATYLHERHRGSHRRIDVFATRSGYTGEDGFEISVAAGDAEVLARVLLAEPEVLPAGLGARDTLRLEAGLCLYGHDIDTTTTPIEAALTWAIQKVRRPGANRRRLSGAATIGRQIVEGVARKRVGLVASTARRCAKGAPSSMRA